MDTCRPLWLGFHGSPTRAILAESEMGLVIVVVTDVFLDHPPKVLLAHWDDVLEEVSS
jgi:hypothetical protein